MARMTSGFGRDADALPDGKSSNGLQEIAKACDEVAATAASTWPPIVEGERLESKIIVGQPAASWLTRLYKPGALGLAFLFTSVAAWPAGAEAPPPTPTVECISADCASPIAPAPSEASPDRKRPEAIAPAASGSSGLSDDHAVGTSGAATPRLELPNNDAGVPGAGGG